MFPDKTSSELEASLNQNGSYSKTVNSLLCQNSMTLFHDNPTDYDTNAAATFDDDVMMNYYIVYFRINQKRNAFDLS